MIYLGMETNMQFIRKMLKNEKGATAIEYGLIAALIAVAAIGAMTSLGSNLSGTFNTVSGKLATTPADADDGSGVE
ncbi:Flp pilus assembly protein, pilin Flp [Sphingobium faniae]|nr:Flp pilus assembly protein, pilin Flp [Sphingobium faniae]